MLTEPSSATTRCSQRARAVPLLVLMTGCHLLLPFEATPGAPAIADRAVVGDLAVEAGRADLRRGDAVPVADASRDPCAQRWPAVASYEFAAAAPLRDALGGHDAAWFPPDASPPLVASDSGTALWFAGLSGHSTPPCGQPAALAWAALAPSDDWQLPRGAIRLRVRFDAEATGVEGLLARDQGWDHDGDFALIRGADGALIARLTVGGQSHWRCSAPAVTPPGRWLELRVVFGDELTLCLDGQAQAVEGRNPFGDRCTTAPVAGGIQRSAERGWVLGATNWCEDVPVLPMHGAVDALRIERAP